MWTRRQLLWSTGACLAVPARAATPGSRLLVIKVDGGWDTTHALDPKLPTSAVVGPTLPPGGEVDEVIVSFGDLPIAVNDALRPGVAGFFGRWGDRCAVVNGLHLGGIAHRPNRVRLLTGTSNPGATGIVTRVGEARGGHTPLGAIDLCGFGFAGTSNALSRVGATGQLRGLVDPAHALATPSGTLAFDPVADAALDAYRRARLDALDTKVALGDLRDAADRADALRAVGADLSALLDVPAIDPPLDTSLDNAMDLLDSGLCVAALVSQSDVPWDTHADNARQHGFHDQLFRSLERLAQRLDDTDHFGDTLVAVVTEIGRAPSTNAELGKDHWPVTSALLFGGPVSGGRALGGTDDHLDPQPVDLQTGEIDPSGAPLRFDQFAAGLLEAVDVDPAVTLPGVAPYRGFRA